MAPAGLVITDEMLRTLAQMARDGNILPLPSIAVEKRVLLRRLDELLEINVSLRTEIRAGPREARQPDYPVAALQQLAQNAVMHRTELSSQWPECLDRKHRAFRVLSALWRVLHKAATQREAALVLIDVGPNLGAFNRAAMVAAEYVVVPLAPDLYSLQGLRNLGPTLRRWQEEWAERRKRNPVDNLQVPSGAMRPVGYVVMQHAVRLDRPVKAYGRWMDRIPAVYRECC
jgi:cellulose biosynthesis protein BcsQ